MRTLSRMNKADIIAQSWVELFQTERSAERHPEVEADRLGDVPPAIPMRLVSAHATNALAKLEGLAKERGFDVASAGKAGKGVGEMFSQVREKVADLVLTNQVSYRGTLLGIRHGIDLMKLVHQAAEDDEELRAWATEWLDERTYLATSVEKELAWFGDNPDVALAPVVDSTLARVAKKLTGRSEPAPKM